MSAFGTSGLTKIAGAVYNVEQDGFATYDKSYSGILTQPISFLQGDVAEEFPNVVLVTIKITETGEQCGHVRVDLHYEGKEIVTARPGVSDNISIDFTTSQEPIESHPDFVTSIGGNPTTPKHGAIFDATTGEFTGFPVVDPDEPTASPSRFAGLRSYLMPQQMATYNSIEYSYPSAAEIGKVGSVIEPGIELPTLPGERNWMYAGLRVQNIGNVYFRTQRVLMLSGPRKWLPEVYGTV